MHTCTYLYLYWRLEFFSLFVCFLPCVFKPLWLNIWPKGQPGSSFHNNNVHRWTNKTMKLPQYLIPDRKRTEWDFSLLFRSVVAVNYCRRHVISRSVTTNNSQHGGVHPGEAGRSVELRLYTPLLVLATLSAWWMLANVASLVGNVKSKLLCF